MKLAGGIAAFALVAVWTSAARADGPAVQSDLHGYYRGEQVAAYVIGGMGLAAAGTGAYLVTRQSDFARGLGWSWLAMGGLEAIGATFYAFQVEGELGHCEGSLARDPSAFRAEEIDHMHGTSSRFVYYRVVELALTLGGAGTAAYGFATNKGGWQGAGIGVASLALPLFLIDGFNDARAHRYLQSVERFHPSVGVAPSGQGMTLSFGGAF